MNHKAQLLIAALIGTSLLLSACAPSAAPTPAQVEVTRVVAGTPETIVITAAPGRFSTDSTASGLCPDQWRWRDLSIAGVSAMDLRFSIC